jgi:DNA-binding XRE family transcriptional regulator
MARRARHISQPLPLWAKRVHALRRKLKLSQSTFGKRLNCSTMGVSRWERGIQKPPARCLIEMGKMAGPPEGWYFWKLAGLAQTDVRTMLGL